MRHCWLLIPIFFFSCASEKAKPVASETSVNVVPVNGSNAFTLDEKYTTAQGMIIKPSDFKFYISDISVQNSDGHWQQLLDAYLFDLDRGQTGFKIEIPAHATRLRYGIGVPKGLNNGDPTLYPNSHPYSIAGSNGMHWGWSSGYKFILFEGKMDTVETGSFLRSFSFHTGLDTLYRQIDVALPAAVKTATMKVDVSKFFNGIDLNTENQSHGGDAIDLAKRFTDNFVNAVDLSLD